MAHMNPWVICPRPSAQARLRLFCFPYAGGGASVFRSWSNELPPDIEVCAIQYPGRESRWQEPLLTNTQAMVPALVEVLSAEFDRPFAFFGYSLGALIGFELARLLAQHQQPGPVHLFVAAHTAPQLPHTEPPIYTLAKPDFFQKIAGLNGTPAEILQNAELMDLLHPVLWADFMMNETYAYVAGSPLECGISAFGGLGEQLIKRTELEAWREQTRQAFTLRMLPGDHFFMHSSRNHLLRSILHDLSRLFGQFNGTQGS